MGFIYNESIPKILETLKSDRNGLSSMEAEKRLETYGKNVIRLPGDPLWRKLIEPFANVFMAVLFVAAAISLYQGHMLDAVIILVIMSINATIYYVQRFSTERILRSLQQHTEQAIEVMRDGVLIKVDSAMLVPGDVIRLQEGDKVPADLRLLEGTSVRADESLLTGESVPITKHTEAISGEKEVYEQTNVLFQGSFIVSGSPVAIVTSTGDATEFGKIAVLSAGINTNSPVQKKIDRLISQIISVVAGIALVAFALATASGMELAEAIRFVLALSVSAVPESLPVAISVILVLGMRRMAARKALVRNMRAIETIGVLTTIATDKTGTLTENKLSVQEVWQYPGSATKITKAAHMSAISAAGKSYDPLDVAIATYATKATGSTVTGKLIASLPFDQAFSMSGNVYAKDKNYLIALKGAPESVLKYSKMTVAEKEKAIETLNNLTRRGFRVIAMAQSVLSRPIESFDALKAHQLEFVGYVAVADTLRHEAKKSIRDALNAGVTVRMITGDHFETAFHIASQLGMVQRRSQVFDSRQMNEMSDEQLDKIIEEIKVFSRVTPEHKFRILTLLKKHNITAMTGDGVNDVPALSNAHVGVAMGSGSQMAKDAGDMILLDDNFKSIIVAMNEGRIIFANVRRMLLYLLSTNAGEVITMLGALIIGLPVPLLPVQILWVNVVTDSCMVIPLGLEPGNKFTMKQKPSRSDAPILSKFMISRMIVMALGMAGVALTIFSMYLPTHGFDYANTLVFSALVVMQWANAFNVRSSFQSVFTRLKVMSKVFYVGLSIAVTLQMLAMFGPLGSLLHIIPVHMTDLLTTGVIAFAVPILIVEIHKIIGRRYFRNLAS